MNTKLFRSVKPSQMTINRSSWLGYAHTNDEGCVCRVQGVGS